MKPTFWEEFTALSLKIWVWVAYILLGWVAQICYNLVRRKKMSFWAILGSLGLAGFVGFLTSMWCYNNKPELAPYIVPIATLSAEKIVFALQSLDWGRIVKDFFSYVSGFGKKNSQ